MVVSTGSTTGSCGRVTNEISCPTKNACLLINFSVKKKVYFLTKKFASFACRTLRLKSVISNQAVAYGSFDRLNHRNLRTRYYQNFQLKKDFYITRPRVTDRISCPTKNACLLIKFSVKKKVYFLTKKFASFACRNSQSNRSLWLKFVISNQAVAYGSFDRLNHWKLPASYQRNFLFYKKRVFTNKLFS